LRRAVSGRFGKRYFISTWLQVREQVKARSIGRGIQINHIAVAGRPAEVNSHVRNTRFSSRLQAVAVQVVPNEVAEFGQLEETCVYGVVGLTGRERVIAAHQRSRVDVAVERIVALIRRADGVARRNGNGNFIRAGFETGEMIVAVCVGGRGLIDSCAVAGGTGQYNRCVRDTGFACILYAVRVFIAPNEVAQSSRLEVTGVPGQVVFA